MMTRNSLKSSSILFFLLLWFGIISKTFIHSTPLSSNDKVDNDNYEIISGGHLGLRGTNALSYSELLNLKNDDEIAPENIEEYCREYWKRQAGYVAYADFNDSPNGLSGRITFTEISSNYVRVTGQLNTGMNDPNPNNYKIRIVYRPSCTAFIRDLDLTPKLNYFINVPGTSAFQADYDTFTVMEIIGMYVQVTHVTNGLLGDALITGI